MAQPQMSADFFASAAGVVVARAKPLTAAQCREIYRRDGLRCSMCSVAVRRGGKYDTPLNGPPFAGAIDHIFPRARGGQNAPENLRVVCKSCNSSKGAK